MVSALTFWMGGGLENRCVGCVYGADGAMHQVGISHYFMRKMHSQTTLKFFIIFTFTGCGQDVQMKENAMGKLCNAQ